MSENHIVEAYACNGTLSHYEEIDNNGKVLKIKTVEEYDKCQADKTQKRIEDFITYVGVNK